MTHLMLSYRIDFISGDAGNMLIHNIRYRVYPLVICLTSPCPLLFNVMHINKRVLVARMKLYNIIFNGVLCLVFACVRISSFHLQ